MFVANTGSLAMRFNEEGVNSSGSLTKALRTPPQFTKDRQRAENTLIGIAKSKGEKLGVVVAKVLSSSIPELQSFVQARGEAPATNPAKLAIQAALLRATEIGLVAKSLGIDDDEALITLEDSEEQHVDDNTAETSGILSPDTAAALSFLVYRISERFKNNGGSGSMQDFVATMKNATNASTFDNVSCRYVADAFDGMPDNATGGGMIFYTPEQEQQVTGTTTDPDADSGGSWWDNLFGNIDKVVDGITKVTGAINTTVGNVKNTSGSIIDQLTNIGGEVGSKSIDQYLKDNWLKVVVVLAALITFTILLARAVKR